MSPIQESSDDLKRERSQKRSQEACQAAWRALAQDRPQDAVEALAPLAEETATDEDLARVWSAMMGWVDDLEHLERELRRLARNWAATATVVLEMTRAISRAWGRLPKPLPFASRESVIGLGVDLLDLCLSEAPPSRPEDRAELFRQRAALLAWAGPLGDERALSDLEIALTLTPEEPNGWFQLARLHLVRGRWEKSAFATERALAHGYDGLRGGWNLAVALTALASQGIPETRTIQEAWSMAGHEEFAEACIFDSRGRAVARGLEPILVSIHSQMVSLGGWDLDRLWGAEAVWVQPLSPCHGRLLHPTRAQLPADFDDLILWDPHPASFEQIDGEERPVMSAIALLERGSVITRGLSLPYVGEERLRALNDALPEGVFLYQPSGPEPTQEPIKEPIKETHDEALVPSKLCWPKSLTAQSVISSFEVTWSRFALPKL